MMLLIDVGNSRIKAGVHELGMIKSLKPCEWRKRPLAACTELFERMERPERVLVSNVAGNAIATALKSWLAEHWRLEPEFMTVTQKFAGMFTHYDRPTQLGVDRWLAALAGYERAGGAACVIDAGTALTVDVVTQHGAHLGGLIAPGLSLMARSLTQGTAQLALDRVQAIDRFATNTAGAISLGCREAVAGILARVALRWRDEIGEAPVWYATGGEAEIIKELSSFPVEIVPDLVLQGIAIVAEHSE